MTSWPRWKRPSVARWRHEAGFDADADRLDPVVWMVAQTKHATILTDLTPEQAMTLADALEQAVSEASKEKAT